MSRKMIIIFATCLLLVAFSYVVYKLPKSSKISFDFPQELTVNDEISVPLEITVTEAVNAAEFYFRFPSDLLEVVKIDQTGSFFQLWIKDYPRFDNQAGTLELAGGLPKPGLLGKGLVATITFKPRQAGQGEIALDPQKSRILLNDGLGSQLPTSVFSPIKFAVK